MAKAKEETIVTVYTVESGWRDERPKVVEIEAVEKPKSWQPLPGQNARLGGYLPHRLLKEEPGRRKWFTDREEAIRTYVERVAYASELARERADRMAREYEAAIEFATAEGVYVEGHSTPDVEDEATRKPDPLEESVARDAAEIAADLDAREAKS